MEEKLKKEVKTAVLWLNLGLPFSIACFITLWKKENENEFYGKMQ